VSVCFGSQNNSEKVLITDPSNFLIGPTDWIFFFLYRDVYNKIIRNPDPTSNKQKRKRSKKGLPYDSSSEEPQQSAGDVKVEGMANSSFGDSLRALKAQYETYIESLQEQVDRLRKINVTQEVKIEQLQKILMESQPPQEVKIPAKALKEVASDPTTSS
jgi:hypothetical protein